MRTAERRVAWAEWAGWICKEPEGSYCQTLRRVVDRRPPSGNRQGFFFVSEIAADRELRNQVPGSVAV